MYLIFDTETTGLVNSKLPPAHSSQPNLVQLGALLMSSEHEVVAELGCIVQPQGWKIPAVVADIHGITTEHATKHGLPAAAVCQLFRAMASQASCYVCHNIRFDMSILETFATRQGQLSPFKASCRQICTMQATTDICQLPGRITGSYKWPKLQEAHKYYFGVEFDKAHSALADVRATSRILFEMEKRGHIILGSAETAQIQLRPLILPEAPALAEAAVLV